MIYDLIIIGAGPAGISTSIYAVRKKMSAIILEKNFEIGGQLIKNSRIDNYPGFPGISGFDLAQSLKSHLDESVIIKETRVLGITEYKDKFKIISEKESYTTRSIVIATGMEPIKSGADGEDEFIGKGISYCATCDAPLYKDMTVAVYGSGYEAESTLIQLLSFAKKIYFLIDKKSYDYFHKEIRRNIKANNIIVKKNVSIMKFEGKDSLNKVIIGHGKKIQKLDVRGVFINLGYIPVTDFINNFIKTNNKKEIIVDIKNKTSRNGVFAAGDCTDYPYKQVITAVAQGAVAALSSYNYLNNFYEP